MIKSHIDVSSLSNGLQIVSEYMPDFDNRVAFDTQIDAGSNYEKPGQIGIAHLTEHELCEGSHSLVVAGKTVPEFFMAGGYTTFNAWTSDRVTRHAEDGRTGLATVVLKQHFDKYFFAVNEAVANPGFTPLQIEKHRVIIQKEIIEDVTPVLNKQRDLLNNQIFGFPAYYGNTLGDFQDVQEITFDSTRAFYEKFYAPNRIILSAAGNIDHDKLRTMAERLWGDRPAGTEEKIQPFMFTPATVKVQRDYSPSSNLKIYFPGDTAENDRGYAQAIFLNLLARHFFDVVREEMKLSYGIGVEWYSDKTSGIYAISNTGADETIMPTLNGLITAIGRFSDLMSPEKFNQAVLSQEQREQMVVRNPAMDAASNITSVVMRGRVRTVEERLDVLHSVRLEDVLALAKRTFTSPVATSLLGTKTVLSMISPDAQEMAQRINDSYKKLNRPGSPTLQLPPQSPARM